MAALPNLMTVAQFRELPEGGEYAYELHHGEVVALTRPKTRHTKLQVRLSRLLELKLKSFGEIIIELPYCPLAEFEVRAADVAAISRSRWDASDPDGYLAGAPDLVIEVKIAFQYAEAATGTGCALPGERRDWSFGLWTPTRAPFPSCARKAPPPFTLPAVPFLQAPSVAANWPWTRSSADRRRLLLS